MKGIGTDILALDRIHGTIERMGERLAQRVMAPEERDGLDLLDAHSVGKAFAAKEAIAKALGTGFRRGIGWHDIHVLRDDLGRPVVQLHGAAYERLLQLGAREVMLSLSDEQDYVVAFAVAH